MSEEDKKTQNSNWAVEVEDLSVRFGDFTAVDRISFRVPQGEIFGFLGANGAGKTTTIRVLCGILTPTEGAVRVAGEPFIDDGLNVKNKVGYMSQKFTLYDDLTVFENLTFASQLRKMPKSLFQKRAQELLNFIGFHTSTSAMVKDLPGGIKQQVSLVAAMLHNPEVLFLDEPTAGVTPAARLRFWELIHRVADRKKTVFVTTHYMDEAEQCQRVALMRTGQLVALDSPQNLKTKYFPNDLLEWEPKGKIQTSDLLHYSKSPAFSLFKPYGMRFHVEVKEAQLWASLRPQAEAHFLIRKISPSLEDVFIRVVEGQG